MAAAVNGVGLSFYYGATLPDPHKLLLGSGGQNRFVRIESATIFKRPEIEGLIAAAIAQAEKPLPESGRGKLTIRALSKKQKPRRKGIQANSQITLIKHLGTQTGSTLPPCPRAPRPKWSKTPRQPPPRA